MASYRIVSTRSPFSKKHIARIISFSIIILGSLLISVYCEGQAGDFSVPPPPQGELLDTKAVKFGGRDIETFLYKTRRNQFDVIRYYRDFFTGQNFENVFDKKEGTSDKWLLRFKKDELVVSIAVTSEAGETEVVVAKFLQPEGAPPPEESKLSVKDILSAIPKKDSPGEDLAFILRPPESVRWTAMQNEGYTYLVYSTSLSVDEARAFYKSQMPKQNWQLENESSAYAPANAYRHAIGKDTLGIEMPFADAEDFDQIINETFVLNFKGHYGKARITVSPNFMDRKKGSVVSIFYNRGG